VGVEKHLDDQLFAAPCTFKAPITFEEANEVKGTGDFKQTLDISAKGMHLGAVNAQHVLKNFKETTAWTPEVEDSRFEFQGQAYTTQVGKFFEIGNLVFFDLHIKMISLGALITSQVVNIVNLPVPMKAGSFGSAAVGQLVGFNLAGTFSPSGRYDPITQSIRLMNMSSTAGHSSVLFSELSADGELKMSGHYEKA